MFTVVVGLEKLGEEDLNAFLPYLTEERRKKVDALRFLPDKLASASAFLLLRCMLKEEWNEDDAGFGYERNGKPYLRSRPDVRFSLSHDRLGVGVCVSDENVGADVQELFPYEKALAERILSERERAVFPTPDEGLLTRMWTCKESLGKFTGEGVYPVMEKTDFSNIKEGKNRVDGLVYVVGNVGGLYYAVCSEKEQEITVANARELLPRAQRSGLKKIQS